MKLLFDENLSPKLPGMLQIQFPGSVHVRDCGLKGGDRFHHLGIRGCARLHATFQRRDFYQRSLLSGPPPKIIWICLGNCTRTQLLDLLLRHEVDIRGFESAAESVLILS